MSIKQELFIPGTLWEKVPEQTKQARACGAIQPILTTDEYVEQGGVRFLVRLVRALAQKEKARGGPKLINPFLPCDENLLVTELSDTHRCVLNKYNVVNHHLLIVTRQFEEQESLLTENDVEALLICLKEIDGLGFYNGGLEAGASQPHKHLQVVPLPLSPSGPGIPIEPLLSTATFKDEIGTVSTFPFVHALAHLDQEWIDHPHLGAQKTLETYHRLLQVVGLDSGQTEAALTQAGPYNLLVTRKWMLLIPRSQECVDSIYINALGFAGGLLAKDKRDMQAIRTLGPMTILTKVGLVRK